MTAKFLIVCQRYTSNSNGIKIMHKICHAINELGGDARLMFIDARQPGSQLLMLHDETWVDKSLNTPVLKNNEKSFIKKAFVIYPETITDNPLGSNKVIRYFGNREGYCNGQRVALGKSDFILSHSSMISSDAHFILFNAEISPAFHNIDSLPFDQRKMDVTYIGKGYIYGGVGVIPNTVYVAREWPQSQEQLGILLRQTRFFYTWDAWTSTNTEAVMCGAVPVILHYGPWKPEEVDGSELGWLPRGEIKNDRLTLDSGKFSKGRDALMEKISHYSLSWSKRVEDFMEKVELHFST